MFKFKCSDQLSFNALVAIRFEDASERVYYVHLSTSLM